MWLWAIRLQDFTAYWMRVRWAPCWRKTHTEKLVSNQCTLVVARNILTGEVKYFLSNRVPGRDGWTLRQILRVAFGRWPIEDCFRETKEELGLDRFECRGWRCIHRHLFVTILSTVVLCPSSSAAFAERGCDQRRTADDRAGSPRCERRGAGAQPSATHPRTTVS